MTDSKHAHARREAELTVWRPVEEAFLLFTPEGERSWATDWDPEYIWPAGGDTTQGMVFTTRWRGLETVWVLTHLDREHHFVEYHRHTPGWFIARVVVECRAVDHSTTRAAVRYDYTALSADGDDLVRSFTQEEHEQMIGEWENEIRRSLRGE
ncbi:MAG: SRPBCC family protein [Acidobacteriota bacterium]